MHNTKKGFAFFEIVVALLILAIIGGALVPRLQHKSPAAEVDLFVQNLNNLVFQASNQALFSQSIFKVVFDFKKRVSWLSSEKKGEKQEGQEFIHWPENIEIVHFYINGEDECKKYHSSAGIQKAWIYVVPDGLAQATVINMIDNSEDSDRKFGLVLNPFSLQFKVYDEFKKP